MSSEESNSTGEATRAQNLIRYQPCGAYFARLKTGGKLIRQSLESKVFAVAQPRVPDKIKEHHRFSDGLGEHP